MRKWVYAVVSGVVGAGLAVVAAWGVVSSATNAPGHNPAGPAGQQQQVVYGSR